MCVRAGGVDDLRHFPDLGVENDDVRGGDRLLVDSVDVAHRLAAVVLPARVHARRGVVLVRHEADVLAVGDRDLVSGDRAGHARDRRGVIGGREEWPPRQAADRVGLERLERRAMCRRAGEQVVGTGPERDAVVAVRVVGREIDVAAALRVLDDERLCVVRCAGVHERAAEHLRERAVRKSRGADPADRLRILRLVDGREPRDESLDELLDDDVRLTDAVVRTRGGHVVDLHDERSAVDRGACGERLPAQGPAARARGRRIGRACGCGRDGWRVRQGD